MDILELLQRQPDDIFMHWRVHLLAEPRCHLPDCRPPVAPLPDRSGSLVEAVSLVAGEIIDQRFARQSMNHQLIRSRPWQ